MPAYAIPVAVCIGAVAVAELISHAFDLWRFTSSTHRAVTAVGAGLGFGLLSIAVAEEQFLVRFAFGAVVGVAYEALNLLILKVWTFPEERLLFLRGRVAIIFAAGIPWGLLPALAAAV